MLEEEIATYLEAIRTTCLEETSPQDDPLLSVALRDPAKRALVYRVCPLQALDLDNSY